MADNGNCEMETPIGWRDLLDVAVTYMEDGAPRTAAARLRDAAARMDRIADERDAYLKTLAHRDG